MIARITGPAKLSGTVIIASSKSEAHRALICAALCSSDQTTRIVCSGEAQDILVTVECLRALGVGITELQSGYGVRGIVGTNIAGGHDTLSINVHESGSTLRFLLPVIAALGLMVEVNAEGRIPDRPLEDLLDALESHGAEYESHAFPLQASGALKGGSFSMPGNVSSQYLTGLLLAAPLLDEDLSIELTSKLESRGYLDLTIEVMRRFGVTVKQSETALENGEISKVFTVARGQRYLSPGAFTVEPDRSSAAFWLGANELGATIQLPGTESCSLQPDATIKDYFGKSAIDISHAPDLFPILAVVAAAQESETRFIKAQRLRYKESDRLNAVACMLTAFGREVVETEDSFIIPAADFGKLFPFTGAIIDSRGDHRIAMAAAIASTHASGVTEILQAESVSKSYPTFYEDFERLGGHIELI